MKNLKTLLFNNFGKIITGGVTIATLDGYRRSLFNDDINNRLSKLEQDEALIRAGEKNFESRLSKFKLNKESFDQFQENTAN